MQLTLPLELPTPEIRDTGPGTSSTFADNLSLPVHRWFRYTAGFSALWVRELIARERCEGRHRVLDPFGGSGTVPLEGELSGVECAALEAHPFVARVAEAKLCWRESPAGFRDCALSVLSRARGMNGSTEGYPKLIERCFLPETLARLDTLKRSLDASWDGLRPCQLTWLALVSIIRECSPVGTAQWQYVLPGKAKSKVEDPYQAFAARVTLMAQDMESRQMHPHGQPAALFTEDARECASIPDGWAHLVITSPPYANNYDYADATRLEMSFFGEVQGWGDLQEAVRRHLVRSCTQHVSTTEPEVFLSDPLLGPILEEIGDVCRRLGIERQSRGGKKQYHAMVAAYFRDLAHVWMALRRVTADGSRVCFVVGDSAPYGVYVPVDRWLGELALAAGFRSYRFEKTRDRNVKWKNRKHRVPLHEGRLWVEG